MKKRPGFITLVAVLYVFSGIGILGMQIWSLINQPELANSIGVSSFLLTTVITFMGIIILIAGIGMFKGERWGWFVSLYYQAFNIGRNALAGVYIFMSRDELIFAGANLSKHYIKFSGRVLIGVAILYYFVSGPVMEYFEINQSKKISYVMKTIGIVILTLIIRDVSSFILN